MTPREPILYAPVYFPNFLKQTPISCEIKKIIPFSEGGFPFIMLFLGLWFSDIVQVFESKAVIYCLVIRMYVLVFYEDVPISEEEIELSGSPVSCYDLQSLLKEK